MIRRLWRRARSFLFDVPDMSPGWMRDQRRQHGLEDIQPPESWGERPAPRREPDARDHGGYRGPGVKVSAMVLALLLAGVPGVDVPRWPQVPWIADDRGRAIRLPRDMGLLSPDCSRAILSALAWEGPMPEEWGPRWERAYRICGPDPGRAKRGVRR